MSTLQPECSRQNEALSVLCLALLLTAVNATLVNVALASIGEDLALVDVSLVWVTNAYLAAFGSFLVLGGRLGDLFGRRRLFLIGVGVFTLASLACGVAQSAAALIAARAMQGAGAAIVAPATLALIVGLFTDAAKRAKALGVCAFASAIGGSLGSLLGGASTDLLGWRGVFLINVPCGIAAVVLGLLWLQPDEGRPKPVRTPLIPPGLLRIRSVRISNLIAALMAAGAITWSVVCALYLQRVLSRSPLEVGLMFLPANLGTALMSLVAAPRLIARFGIQKLILAGLIIVSLGLALLARAPLQANLLFDVLPGMLLVGVGLGLAYGPLLLAALSGVAPADSGAASGVINTSFAIGCVLALSILAPIATARTHELLAKQTSLSLALLGGYSRVLFIAAVLVAAAALISGALLRVDAH